MDDLAKQHLDETLAQLDRTTADQVKQLRDGNALPEGFTLVQLATLQQLRAERDQLARELERALLRVVNLSVAWDRLREALTTIIALEGRSSRIADIAAKALAGGGGDV